jgi:hypothetical protein
MDGSLALENHITSVAPMMPSGAVHPIIASGAFAPLAMTHLFFGRF